MTSQAKRYSLLNKGFLSALRCLFGLNKPQQAISFFNTLSEVEFLKLCRRHKLIGHLHNSLDKVSVKYFKHLKALQRDYVNHTKRGFCLIHEMDRVQEALKKNNLQCLFFKGPKLSQKIYGNAFQRTSCDLDLYIKYKDSIQGVRILEGLGYDSPLIGFTKNVDRFKYFSSCIKDIPMYHQNGNICLELHWNILERDTFALNFHDPIESSASSLFFGKKTLEMEEKQEVFYLILHGVRHRWNTFQLIHDMYHYLSSKKINLDEIRTMFVDARVEILWDHIINLLSYWYPDFRSRSNLESRSLAFLKKVVYNNLSRWGVLSVTPLESYHWFIEQFIYNQISNSGLKFRDKLALAKHRLYPMDPKLLLRCPRFIWPAARLSCYFNPLYKFFSKV